MFIQNDKIDVEFSDRILHILITNLHRASIAATLQSLFLRNQVYKLIKII